MTVNALVAIDGIDGDCRYICENGICCCATRRRGSSYCPIHHTLCHIERRSPTEASAIRAIGRMARMAMFRKEMPSGAELMRLERILWS